VLVFIALGVALGVAVGISRRSPSAPSTNRAAADAAPSIVVDGLDGPTQFTDGPSVWLLVAQLAGDEDAGTGQVLAVDTVSGKRLTVLTGLDKPTGVAWLNGFVWVMERRRLVRASWGGAGTTAGPLEILVDNLAFNGRSEGTLTTTPDNRVVYETTGSISNGKVVPNSGTLWVFDPLTKTSTKVAVGLKNAYAHVFGADGRLFTTEIGDNIEQAPVEEINVVPYSGPNTIATNFGWPLCAGDQTCAGVTAPLATFERNSTPTGIAVDTMYAYVSLLVTGELRRVKLSDGTQTVLRTGLEGPHTVLRRADGMLWISEHFGGRIVAVQP
jgi:glucose/arabinose dehydrogenase